MKRNRRNWVRYASCEQHGSRRRRVRRRLLLEQFQKRQLWAADVSLSLGNLLIADLGSGDDQLSVTTDGSEFVISDTGGADLTTSINAATDLGTTIRVPFSAITGTQVIINGGGGDDLIVLGGAFAPSNSTAATTDQFDLIIDGGGGIDTLVWNGASRLGTITATAEGIELSADVQSIGNHVWNGPVTVGGNASIGGADIRFENTVDGSDGTPTLITATSEVRFVGEVGATHVPEGLTITSPDGLTVSGQINVGAGGLVATSSGDVTINGPLQASSSGSISLTTERSITVGFSGSVIVNDDGDITLSANQQPIPTSGSFVGVQVNGGLILAGGAGSITIDGRGGDSGNAQAGIRVQSGGRIIGGVSGLVDVRGQGGDSAGNNNDGVYVADSGSTITSTGASLRIAGTSGGVSTSSFNRGVHLRVTEAIAAGGFGDVTVNGTGTNLTTGRDNSGVFVTLDGSITSGGGDVTVTGTGGGSGGSTGNYGVFLEDLFANASALLSVGGLGTLTVTGTGGNAAGTGVSNFGVYLVNPGAQISSAGGPVTIQATGTPTSDALRMVGLGGITSNGGDMTILAAGDIDLAGAVSTSNATGAGDLSITAGNLSFGNLVASGTSHSGGDVTIAAGDISGGMIQTSTNGTDLTDSAGDIDITSSGVVGLSGPIQLRSFASTNGSGGSATVNAAGDIQLGSLTTSGGSSLGGDSGSIELTSSGGSVTTSELQTRSFIGASGSVTVSALNDVTLVSFGSELISSWTQSIDPSDGGGSVSVIATTGTLSLTHGFDPLSQVIDSSARFNGGSGGDIQLIAGGDIVTPDGTTLSFQARGANDVGGSVNLVSGGTRTVMLESVRSFSQLADGGSVSIDVAGGLEFNVIVSDSQSGRGGDVTLRSGDLIGNLIRTWTIGDDATDSGGDIDITSSGSVGLSGALQFLTLANSIGSGGSINVNAGGDVQLASMISSGGANQTGNSGDISVVSVGGNAKFMGPINSAGFLGDGGAITLTAEAIEIEDSLTTSGVASVEVTSTVSDILLGDQQLTSGTDLTLSAAGSIFQDLGGTFAVAGDLSLDLADSLIINGNLPIDYPVIGGTTLGGSGRVEGAVTVMSGSFVRPGNSPGILNTGDFELMAGATLEIEIAGTTVGTQYDQVNVSGSVELDGELSLLPLYVTAPIGGSELVIINNDLADAVSGTFNGLAEGATVSDGVTEYTLSYKGGDGNDVVLTSLGTVFTVINTLESGPGSLHQAILDANANAGPDVIRFDIGSGGTQIIAPTTVAFPAITESVLIDGFTETGASANTLPIGSDASLTIVLDGTGLDGTGAFAFDVQADDVTLRGLRIQDWGTEVGGGAIITAATADDVIIAGNWIGTDADIEFGRYGVLLRGSDAMVGGPSVADRNVISSNETGIEILGGAGAVISGNYIGTDATGMSGLGNAFLGILVSGVSATITENVVSANGASGIKLVGGGGSVVRSNIIGLDANGDLELGNGNIGVVIDNSPSNLIGGAGSLFDGGLGNVISGNDFVGIYIFGSGAVGNVVQGNDVGTDQTGSVGRGNADAGIVVLGPARATQIGGDSTLGLGNLISGNGTSGIAIGFSGVGSTDNVVQGNLIGLDRDGTTALGNGSDGVAIAELGSSGNQVGGIGRGEGNVISGNDRGIVISAPGSDNNLIQGNLIGVDITGRVAISNNIGVALDGGAKGNRIGGNTASHRNVISGNRFDGIRFDNGDDNTIAGNYLGVNIEGERFQGINPSGGRGVFLFNDSDGNRIGGDTPGERNVIAGNTDGGVTIEGGSDGNRVSGNVIRDNGLIGVFIDGAPKNLIGTGAVPGDLFVSSFETDSVYWFDGVTGELVTTLGGGGLSEPTDVVVGPDNNIYVGNRGGENVLRFDGRTGALLDVFATGIPDPREILFHSDGFMYVIANNDAAIRRYDAETGVFVDTISVGPSDLDGMTFGPDGNLYVADGLSGVKRYTTSGTFIDTFVANGAGGLDRPIDVEFGSDGRLYVVSGRTNSVLRYNGATGQWIDEFVESGSGGVVRARSLEFDTSGDLLVVGEDSDAVYRYDGRSGAFVEIAIVGGGLDRPFDVAFAPALFGSQGNVIDGNQHGVVVSGAVSIGNVIGGNQIGLGGANGDGVRLIVDSSFTSVGGDSAGQRNVISGNRDAGVRMEGSGNNRITGNFIGTDPSGSIAVGNGYGVEMFSTFGNRIGGSGDGEGNLIAGNANGLVLQSDVIGSLIQGNTVGWDLAGRVALGGGVSVQSGSDNLIGTDGDGLHDAVEGNRIRDLYLAGRNSVVAGNWIGVAADGITAGGDAISVAGTASGIRIGTNSDGVSDEEERNVIRGISISTDSIDPTIIAGNYIGTNVDGDAQIIGGGFGVQQTNSVGATLIKDNRIAGNLTVGVSSSASTGIAYGARSWFEAEDATDSFGTNDLIARGGATFAPGLDGSAFSFDGSGAYFELAPGTALGLSVDDFTIEGWINPDVAVGSVQTIVDRSDGGDQVDYRLELEVDGRLRLDVGGLTNPVYSKDPISAGRWTHVAAVQNRDSGEIRLYVDGVVVSAAAAGSANLSSDDFYLGVRESHPGFGRVGFFDGLIDDVALYARALDAAEILAIANARGVNKQGGLIIGNTIGIGSDGSAVPNGANDPSHAGASLGGTAAVIGGERASLRNVIAGNGVNNLLLNGGAGYHVVAGNFIGLGPDGQTSYPGATVGIEISGSSNHNVIGGRPALGNVISGNGADGVAIANSTDTAVAGNWIGTDASGTIARGNGNAGIRVRSGTAVIGEVGIGNVIAGAVDGIVTEAGAMVTVQGNRIGTDIGGAIDLGNSGAGIELGGNAIVGGPGAGQGNIIAFNGAGTRVTGNTTAASIRGNVTFSNAGLPIDLGGDGPTANDPGDADVGPNGLQNYPVLVNAAAGARTTITGTFEGESGVVYQLDFYAGRRYLGSDSLIGTGASVTFDVDVGTTFNGEGVTATATRDSAQTSEYSEAIAATTAVPPAIGTGQLIVSIEPEVIDEEQGAFPITTNTIDEGTEILLDGTFVVPSENHRVRIFWGDGEVSDSFDDGFYVRDIGFSARHVYSDDLPSGTAQDDYTIEVIVTDTLTGASGLATTTVTVVNVPAKFDGPVRLTPQPVGEGRVALLQGSIIDPGVGEQHTLRINWDDGSEPELYVVPQGSPTFSVPHAFRDETNPDGDPIEVSVTLADDDSGTDVAKTNAVVTNLPPTATIVGPGNGVEGTLASFSAVGSDPGADDLLTFRWKVFEGDRQVDERDGPTLDFRPIDQGAYTIELITRDDDGGVFRTSTPLLATNAPPEIDPASLVVTDLNGGRIEEGDRVTIRGSFRDSGAGDSFNVEIRWGDQPAVETLRLPAGATSFSFSHTYADDLPDDTPQDDFDIRVRVTDSEGAFDEAIETVTVFNVAPEILIIDDGSTESTIRVRGVVSDVDSDPLTYQWSAQDQSGGELDLGGIVTDTNSLELERSRFRGLITVILAATDDDRGTSTQSALYIAGSDGADTIRVDRSSTNPDNLTLTIDTPNQPGSPTEIVAPGILLINGLGENDTIVVADDVTTPTSIDGGDGNDRITGGGGEDYLDGGVGDDVMTGGEGADTLVTADGDDTLFGGLGGDLNVLLGFSSKTLIDEEGPEGGIDTIDFSGIGPSEIADEGVSLDLAATGTQAVRQQDAQVTLIGTFENVNGTRFNDRFRGNDEINLIFGGPGQDSIIGGGGPGDSLDGGTGEDTLVGGDGNDFIFGGTGNDSIIGGESGDETLVGGDGNDFIFGGGIGDDSVDGGVGNDSIIGGDGNDFIFGGAGNDSITGGDSGDETLIGGDGNDFIFGGGRGNDSVDGGFGDDSLIGGDGNDFIFGGAGDDSIDGGLGGDETLIGGDGNDFIFGGGTGNDSVFGGSGDDSIIGGDGNDFIFGGSGDDSIIGGSGGDESLVGGDGNDYIFGGGFGDDSVLGGFGDDTIIGGDGNDFIFGGSGDDSIAGGDGDATLVGGDGNDYIFGGGAGDDSVEGGFGDDTIVGGDGNDLIFGGAGNDSIMGGGQGNETLIGGDGNDFIFGGGAGDDSVEGGSGDDTLIGGDGNDFIFGGSGDDSILGGSGDETLVGGDGNDYIFGGGTGDDSTVGGFGDDTIVGGDGNDFIFGGDGDDSIVGGGGGDETLVGGDGNDYIFGGGPGNDSVEGGLGDDTLVGGDGNDFIFGGMGDDSIVGGGIGDETLIGGDGNDFIFGGGIGDDSIEGGSGDDTLIGGDGNDFIFGGDGDDSIIGGERGDETLIGGDGNDYIFGGGDGNDSIEGGLGDDTLVGGDGNDFIFGGTGDDSITGGDGSETLIGGDGNDYIFGGLAGDDSVHGGDGDDTLVGGDGNDFIYGGDGRDTFQVTGGKTALFGGNVLPDGTPVPDSDRDLLIVDSGEDLTLTDSALHFGTVSALTISDIQAARLTGDDQSNLIDASSFTGDALILGGFGDDTLISGDGKDTLLGGSGDDFLAGGAGDDDYRFAAGDVGSKTVTEAVGQGNDTLDFSLYASGVTIDLTVPGPQTVADGLVVTLVDPERFENVFGTPLADVIRGNQGDNELYGLGGVDELDGRGGNDLLQSGLSRTVVLDFDTRTAIDGSEHVYTTDERAGILDRVRADFAPYDIQVLTKEQIEASQIPLFAGPFITVEFNGDTGFRGGIVVLGDSERLGWRELAGGGVVSVNTTAYLGANGNVLPGTPENYIAMSSTIASHELAHMYGLRHHDSLGPVGSGLFVDQRDRSLPVSRAPRNADRTPLHLVASPNSVGTRIIDTLGDPYFGERESIKLAFAESGSTFVESELSTVEVQVNGLTQLAYELGELTPVAVPEVVAPSGALLAAATNVVGRIELDALGTSESDFYTFTSDGDEFVTIEVLSQSLSHRIANVIDSVVRVYDPAGNKIDYYDDQENDPDALGAFNDNGFEGIDALLLDLRLELPGTYTIEVDTFSFSIPEAPVYLPKFFDADGLATECTARPAAVFCNDTDTGDYEMVIYRVDASNTGSVARSDTLIGGLGGDVLIGNSGNETLFGFDPSVDTFSDPSGTPIVLEAAPEIQPVSPQTVDEGSTLTFDISGGDADGQTLVWSLEPIGGQVFPTGATLLSDGPFDAVFSFSPVDQGVFAARAVATDSSGASSFIDLQVTVENVVPRLETLADESLPASVGGLFTRKVRFDDPGQDDWTGSVTYEAGTSPQPLLIDPADRSFDLSYRFTAEGTFTVLVQLDDGDGGRTQASFDVTVQLGSPPVITALSGPNAAIAGQVVSYAVETDDPAATITWRVTDHQGVVLETGTGAHFNYRPVASGEQMVTVIATNGVGPSSAALPLSVARVGVVDDDLYVGGTEGDDILSVYRDEQNRLYVYDGIRLLGEFDGVTDRIIVNGFDGNDFILISKEITLDTELNGGDGFDWIVGGSGNDTVSGGRGRDWINGRNGQDVLFGNGGDDLIFGGNGTDWLGGGGGNDFLDGGSGKDTLAGGRGEDSLFGGLGKDSFLGMEGDDLLVGGKGLDQLEGGLGRDAVFEGDQWWQ